MYEYNTMYASNRIYLYIFYLSVPRKTIPTFECAFVINERLIVM